MNEIKCFAIGAGVFPGGVLAIVIGTGITAFIYTMLYHPIPAENVRLGVQAIGAAVLFCFVLDQLGE